jgi:integrase
MQVRPYDERDGSRIWLSREEQAQLQAAPGDDYPRRRIAFELGLHGLRSDEVASVEFGHVRTLDDGEDEQHVLIIPDGKTGRRRVPIDADLRKRIKFLKSANRASLDDRVVDVATRTMRSWMSKTREELAERTENDEWHDLGMHDLRRTFATDTFYTLAYQGVPIAEELTMAFGGWKMTSTGRETFREHYLGPVPDHITRQAAENLAFG